MSGDTSQVVVGREAAALSECVACPECGEPDATVDVVRYGDTVVQQWRCCGQDYRCPGCGGLAVHVHRVHGEVGAYCIRCPWSAS